MKKKDLIKKLEAKEKELKGLISMGDQLGEEMAIARDIESRLVTIYTKLAMLERYIKTSKTLKSMLFDTVMNGIDHSKRRSICIEALNRWKESAGQAILTNNRRREEEPGGDI